MSDNPAALLVDLSGSQVGTSTNPLFISGSLSQPTIQINNNVYTIEQPGADVSASFILVSTTGSLPNSKAHSTLRQLIHLDDSDGPRGSAWATGLVKDIDTSSPFPSGAIWWTSVARTQRIADVTITRNDKQQPTVIQWRAYESDGVTVAESYTDTITYVGISESTRVRTQP
jgi:hypothetical protein